MAGSTVCEMIRKHKVTAAAGVPTVFAEMLLHLERTGEKPAASLKQVNIGGAAMPLSMLRAFEHYGVDAVHAWGEVP